MIGQTVSHFRIVGTLGAGGMGVVYKAEDTRLQRPVALKFLPPHLVADPHAKERFLTEARAASALDHPNICVIHEIDETEEGELFIVMAYYPGEPLTTRIERGPLPVEEAVDLAIQAGRGLARAHGRGIVHRDVKPANLLVTADGLLKILDFGVAKLVGSTRLTQSSRAVGTVSYMAPEQAEHSEASAQADVWSLGVVLYEMVAGSRPFRGATPVAVLYQIMAGELVPLREVCAGVPTELDRIVSRALARDLAARYETMTELVQELEYAGIAGPPRSGRIPSDRHHATIVTSGTTSLPFLTPASTTDAEADAFAFVGRDDELHRLDAWLGTARAGKGRVGFITGDPGSGKTALAREFCRAAMDRDPSLIVVSGACNAQTGAGDPYHPFRDILGLLTGDVEARWSAGSVSADHATRLWSLLPSSIRALLDSGPDLVGSLVPDSGLLARTDAHTGIASRDMTELHRLAKRRASAPDPRQTDLCEQYLRVLRHLARERTLLLLVDDLQWADPGTVSLLFHLGRRLPGSRILVLGLYRPAEVALGREGERHPLDPVVNEFAGLYGDVRIELGLEGDRDFVDHLLDAEPNILGRGFRDSLFRQTKGHALYTVELLRSFREQGVLTRNESDAWVASPNLDWTLVPPRVEAAIGERIQRLSPELQELLTVASVEGEEFTLEVAAQVLGSDVRGIMTLVSLELEKRHRLVATQGLRRVHGQRQSICRFRHSLFQRYLYDRLDPIQRPDLHGRVGEALVTLYGNQEGETSVELAHHFREAGLDPEAVKYLALAGAWAKRTGAPSVSMGLYRDALEILQRLPATTDRDRQEMQLNLALGQAMMEAGNFAFPETEAFYSTAAELAQRLGEEGSRLQSNMGLYLVLQQRRDIERAYRLAEENLALAEALGIPVMLFWARDALARIVGIRGDQRRAVAILEGLLAGLEERSHSGEEMPGWGWAPKAICLTTLSMHNWIGGRPDTALERGLRGLGMARQSADPATPTLALLYVTFLRLWRREPDEAEKTISELAALVDRFGMSEYLALLRCQKGWCSVERGDLDEGIGLLRTGLEGLRKSGSTIWITRSMAVLAGALIRKGSFEEASAILEEALRDEVTTKDLEHHAETLRQKGQLLMVRGEGEAAEAVLRKAIAVAREQGTTSYELRACTTLAELLDRSGRGEEGRDILGAAYAGFTEGFETADLIRAHELLTGT